VPIVRFIGVVTPRELGVSLSFPNATLTQGDIHVRLSIRIKDGEIDATCDINRFNHVRDWLPLYARVHELVRATVDLVAFSKGAGLAVVFEKIILADGSYFPIVFLNRNLAEACTCFQLESGPSFSQMFGIVMNERGVFMALNDLVSSLTVPEHAVLGCYRSVERVRHLLAPDFPRDRQWSMMRDSLRLSKGYIDLITRASTGPRHGEPRTLQPDEISEIVERCWVIMNRFLEFRKRGNAELPVSEFPILE
jgi:hypothetical protein